LGLREDEAGVLCVAPLFPQIMRKVGALYRVEPVQWGAFVLSIECRIKDESGYIVRLNWAGQQQEWEGTWGEERRISLSSPDLR
jgi:hypothetical protein